MDEEDSLVVRLKVPLRVLLASMRRDRNNSALRSRQSLRDPTEPGDEVGSNINSKRSQTGDALPLPKKAKPLPPWDANFSEVKITQDLDNVKENLLRGLSELKHERWQWDAERAKLQQNLEEKDAIIEDQGRRLKEAILELDRSNHEHAEQKATSEQEVKEWEERNRHLEGELDATKMVHQDDRKKARGQIRRAVKEQGRAQEELEKIKSTLRGLSA